MAPANPRRHAPSARQVPALEAVPRAEVAHAEQVDALARVLRVRLQQVDERERVQARPEPRSTAVTWLGVERLPPGPGVVIERRRQSGGQGGRSGQEPATGE